MSNLDFDFELIFTTQFDADVILNSDVPDKSQEFQDTIQQNVNSIKNILTLYPGINTMTTFTDYQDKKYKITVI